jgi:hypothetical protein
VSEALEEEVSEGLGEMMRRCVFREPHSEVFDTGLECNGEGFWADQRFCVVMQRDLLTS